MQNLINFGQFIQKIFSGNKILSITKGHNCVVYLQKLMRNIPNLDLVNVNAYAKFGLIPLIRSQDIERKQSRNIGQPENSISPSATYFVCRGIITVVEIRYIKQ